MARDTDLDFDPDDVPDTSTDRPPRDEVQVGLPLRPVPRGPLPIPTPPGTGTATGDVTAEVIDGHLYLRESAGFEGTNNGVLITQLPGGVIRIEGIAVAGGPASLINGAAFQEFVVTGNLSIDFGAGKDRVEFSINGTAIFQDVTIDVGADSAVGDGDNDVIAINNFEAQGSVNIRTGAGADRVSFLGSTHVAGSVEIRNYSSADEADRDVVRFQGEHSIDEGLAVHLGGGDDDFIANDISDPGAFGSHLTVYGALAVYAGAGVDNILMAQVITGSNSPYAIDSLLLFTGAGGDRIEIDNCGFDGATIKTWDSLDEIDDDVVHVQRTRFAVVTVDLGGGDDDFFVTDPEDMAVNRGIYADILHVTTGTGDDKVHIEGTVIGPEFNSTGILLIQTGAGADEVTVDFHDVPLPNGNWLTSRLHGNLGIQTYDDPSEADVDQVNIPSAEVTGFATIDLGAGDDVFAMLGGNYGSFFLSAGDGADVGEFHGFIDGYQDNVCRIHMGRGTDVLTLGNVRGADVLSLSGGEDGDSLIKTQELVAIDQLFEEGWEYINGFPTWPDDVTPGTGGVGGVFVP